jgi:hypothetical protein
MQIAPPGFPGRPRAYRDFLPGPSLLSLIDRRMKVDAVPRGFRSTFRDWASERTNYPRDVAEMALAHAMAIGEAAYRRPRPKGISSSALGSIRGRTDDAGGVHRNHRHAVFNRGRSRLWAEILCLAGSSIESLRRDRP